MGFPSWVRNEKRQVGGRVDEGVGWIDEKSKGSRVYWPKKCTVSVNEYLL